MAFDTDFLVIGSGFGGSVSALRLTEKGYKVIIAEQGSHISAENMPRSVRQLKQFMWFAPLKYKGFFSIALFKHFMVLHGNAVGGGSITYANTLLIPKDIVWQQGTWQGLADWQNEMPQHYETAKKMLGVSENKLLGHADYALRDIAKSIGRDATFYRTDVAVYFSPKDKYAHTPINGDPYFGGKGPARSPCIGCGGCMAGCRYNAKNTLDKNYLYFAQQHGAELRAETQVCDIVPLGNKKDGSAGYQVTLISAEKGEYQLTTQHIVLSASSLGSQKLLFEQRQKGNLPNISQQLGKHIYTNAEALLGVRFIDTPQGNMNEGIAIGSGIYLEDGTHIEATRYPDGFNLAALLATLSNFRNGKKDTLFRWIMGLFFQLFTNPKRVWRILKPSNMAKESVILLCMQSTPYDMDMVYRKKMFPFSLGKNPYKMQSQGQAIPSFIPVASEFADKMATQMGGTTFGMLSEVFLNIPTTAHCMGGVSLGQTSEDGVVDRYHRLFNYQGFYVCDGSNISSNLGVNPSLTITALAEHAMSHIPAKMSSQ